MKYKITMKFKDLRYETSAIFQKNYNMSIMKLKIQQNTQSDKSLVSRKLSINRDKISDKRRGK